MCPQNFGDYADMSNNNMQTNLNCMKYCANNFYDYAGTIGTYNL